MYIKKFDFRDLHYHHGELYMEYLKGDCSESSPDRRQCAQCQSSEWISPKMSRIPRPDQTRQGYPNFTTRMCLKLTIMKVNIPSFLMTGNLEITLKTCLKMGN